MEDMFTAEEWFTLLEPEVRAKATVNRQQYTEDTESTYGALANALHGSFIWARTTEGHEFWFQVYVSAQIETRKPATNRGMIDCTIREGE